MLMRSQLLFRPLLLKTYIGCGGQPSNRRHVDNQTFCYRAKFQKLWIGHALPQCHNLTIAPMHCLIDVNIPPLLAFLISGKPLSWKILSR